jgi:hypothetical protein
MENGHGSMAGKGTVQGDPRFSNLEVRSTMWVLKSLGGAIALV